METTALDPDSAATGAAVTGAGVAGGVSAEGLRRARCYDGASAAFGSLAAVVNAAHGELVDLTVLTLAEGHHVGPGLHSPAQYVAWQMGVSKATANRLVRIARRAGELPHLVGALRAGAISLDQADVVAQHCPARYERAATDLAMVATVAQLRTVMAAYRDRPVDDEPAPGLGVSIHRDRHGATVRARLSGVQADVFEAALDAMRSDLFRQRRDDARNAATEAGSEPGSVGAVSAVDALIAVAQTALGAGAAAHPGSERYLISYHLHVGPDGHPVLTDDRGRPVAEGDRHRILCDCTGEAVFHDHRGVALSVGRKTRVVGPKLRRTILFRHRHRCAIPGCDTSYGLEIHHICHWEHGGTTNTANLIALCHHHHKAHHDGQLDIDGNADLPAGTAGAVSYTTPDHTRLPHTPPRPQTPGPATARTIHRLHQELQRRSLHRNHYTPRSGHDPGPVASTPTGEPLNRWAVHLNADPPGVSPPTRR